MYDSIQSGELKRQARRLLGYRMPLILVILVNIAVVMRVPMPAASPARAYSPILPFLGLATQPTEMRSAGTAQAHNEPASHETSVHQHAAVPPISADASWESFNGETVGTLAPLTDPLSDALARATRLATLSATPANTQRGPLVATVPSNALYPAETDPPSPVPGDESGEPTGDSRHRDIPVLAQRWLRAVRDTLRPTQVGQAGLASSRPPEPSAVTPADSQDVPNRSPELPPRPSNPAVTPSAQWRIFADEKLIIQNPPENSEIVRFLVNDRLYVLLPGEAHRFADRQQHVVKFHRGGDLDDEERTLSTGIFQFVASPQGWELVPATSVRR